ncbi:Tetraspanin/Peripherin, partial [Corchorus capsularis]
MARVSNFIVVFVNTLLLIVGLVSLAFGVVFTVQGDTHCEKVMTKPALILGGFVAAVALLGLIGSLCKSNFFMFIYLTIVFLLIVGLIGFAIFVFLITNPGAGK